MPAAHAMQLQRLAKGLVIGWFERYSLGSPHRDPQTDMPVTLAPLQPSPGHSHEVPTVLARDRTCLRKDSKGPEPLVGGGAFRPELPQDLRHGSLAHPNDALEGLARHNLNK